MTTEEKAKAYDEAIERAKTLYNSVFVNNDILEQIFPELAESEDERIRKFIVSVVEQYARVCEKEGDPCDASLINDALIYLENQKKQKPEEWSDEDERIRKEIRDFICWETDRGSITAEQRMKSDSWLAYLEKQKECGEANFREGYLHGFEDAQKEQKPAEWEWPNLSNCIRNCKKCHGKCLYRKEPYEEKQPAEQEQKPETWVARDKNEEIYKLY